MLRPRSCTWSLQDAPKSGWARFSCRHLKTRPLPAKRKNALSACSLSNAGLVTSAYDRLAHWAHGSTSPPPTQCITVIDWLEDF